jgi:hypothetical protein
MLRVRDEYYNYTSSQKSAKLDCFENGVDTMRPFLTGIYSLIFLTSISAPVNADDLAAQAQALKVISSFASETCGSAIPLEGDNKHLELSGDVKAELAGIVKKVADLGISGAGKYQSDQFKNVLHEQLAQALQDTSKCKLRVFELLQEKMIYQR